YRLRLYSYCFFFKHSPTSQFYTLSLHDALPILMEEKLFAALLAVTPDDEVLSVRTEVDRELAPYRRKMPAAQIGQLQKQYVHKRSEEHTSELQSRGHLVCRLLLEKKKEKG